MKKPQIHLSFGFSRVPHSPLVVKKFLVLSSEVLPLVFHFPGQNCLHLASVQGYLSLIENMVDLGADINAKVNNTHSHTCCRLDDSHTVISIFNPRFN